MSSTSTNKVRWTTADLELFPDDGKRYEIIDGDLFATRAPHWKHQQTCVNISTQLKLWSDRTKLGQVAISAGIIFTDEDNVIPDIIWASNETLATLLDDAGHLIGAPELVVEVLSPGEGNEKRDRQLKLKLYSTQGVREYWICDRLQQKIEVYRRENAVLKLTVTLFKDDSLTSSLLPDFNCLVASLFE